MVTVIGDIHGCYNTFLSLLEKVKTSYPNIETYCVGDLVDRGKFGYEVIHYIQNSEIKFTPGNHDYMFYHFFKDPESIFARTWVFNGSETTMESYDDHEEAIFKHLEYIKCQPLFYNLNDCFISHAGVSEKYSHILPKNVPVDFKILEEYIYSDKISDSGILWNRDSLMNIGKLQVFGHTKHQKIIFNEDSLSVNIDTGASYGNKLSAIVVHNNEIVDTFEEFTHIDDLI